MDHQGTFTTCHSERSEESKWMFVPSLTSNSTLGSFASLRMTGSLHGF